LGKPEIVDQEPAYLKNQSRRLHALYRRNRRFLNITVSLWEVSFLALFALAIIDRFGSMGWGYVEYLWPFLGFIVFGFVFWVFGTLIQKLNLAYVRHTYGPEPMDR
jgi:hypothetical protein